MGNDYKIGVVVGLLFLAAGVAYFVWIESSGEGDPVATEGKEELPEVVLGSDETKTAGDGGRAGTQNSGSPFSRDDTLGGGGSATGEDMTVLDQQPPAGQEDVSTGTGKSVTGGKTTGTAEEGIGIALEDSSKAGTGAAEDAGTGEELVSSWNLDDDTGFDLSSGSKDPTAGKDFIDVTMDAGTGKDTTGFSSAGTAEESDELTVAMDDSRLGGATSDSEVDSGITGKEAVPVFDEFGGGEKETAGDGRKEEIALEEMETGIGVATGRRTYTVKEGDSGFWEIAEKAYGPGNGMYWRRIQKANPGVNSRTIRPGKILTIPALTGSRKEGGLSGGGESTAEPAREKGTVFTDTDGKKYYIVSSKDGAGLWGIAAKPEVYGKGYRYKLLEKANPGIDSSKLRPGMKLLVPPLPATAEEKKTPTAADDSVDVGLAGGGKRYTVVAGDQGFWGISKKVYGSGKYFGLIRKANPGVDPQSLRIGTVLVIPPLDTAAEVKPVPAPVGADEDVPAGVPDFGS